MAPPTDREECDANGIAGHVRARCHDRGRHCPDQARGGEHGGVLGPDSRLPPGNMDKFKQVVAGLVAASKQEPGTLEYEYAATADNGTVDIIERYVDSDAVVHHVVDNFGAHFAKQFLALVKLTRFAVYGTPSAKAKEALAALN